MIRTITGGIPTKEHARIHAWIRNELGAATECWNPNCEEQLTHRTHWALKHGRKYGKRTSDFVQLCPKCHWKYDRGTAEQQKAIHLFIKDLSFMEVLLVRFTKPQRVFIRRVAKKLKTSEAGLVRASIDILRETELETIKPATK